MENRLGDEGVRALITACYSGMGEAAAPIVRSLGGSVAAADVSVPPWTSSPAPSPGRAPSHLPARSGVLITRETAVRGDRIGPGATATFLMEHVERQMGKE